MILPWPHILDNHQFCSPYYYMTDSLDCQSFNFQGPRTRRNGPTLGFHHSCLILAKESLHLASLSNSSSEDPGCSASSATRSQYTLGAGVPPAPRASQLKTHQMTYIFFDLFLKLVLLLALLKQCASEFQSALPQMTWRKSLVTVRCHCDSRVCRLLRVVRCQSQT